MHRSKVAQQRHACHLDVCEDLEVRLQVVSRAEDAHALPEAVEQLDTDRLKAF